MIDILKRARCYLIGNLESESLSFALDWRIRFAHEVKDMGIICLNPLEKMFSNFKEESFTFREEMFAALRDNDFDKVHKSMQEVRRRDLAAVDRSDFVVAYLNPLKPTFGSVEELSLAVSQNKHIFLVINGGKNKCPLWLAGMIKPKFLYNNLDEVILELRKINSGDMDADNEHWRLLNPEFR